MSISSALNSAISGLAINSRMAAVTSDNLANAMTDGYGRRSLETSSSFGGVRADGINRRVNAPIIAERRLAEADLGGRTRMSQMLERLEGIVGRPGDTGSIANRMSGFEAALITAGSDPNSTFRLDDVSRNLAATAGALRSASGQIQGLRAEADAAIAADVDALNRGIARVETFNADLSRTRSAGQDTSSILDARQQVIDELSGIVSLRVFPRENGQVALFTTQGMTLLDGKAQEFSFGQTPIITAEMTMASTGLSGIERAGSPVDSDNGFGRLSGGSLAAAFALRDQVLVDAQNGLDTVALDFGQRLQRDDVDPSLTSTSLGALADSGQRIESVNLAGLAARITVNPAVDPNRGGSSSTWRDGILGSPSQTVDDASQINRWITELSVARPIGSETVGTIPRARVFDQAAEIGKSRLLADQELGYTSARWDSLHQTELADGVDSDAELQNLLLIEQSYAANAKVIQTLSSMLQTLMEI